MGRRAAAFVLAVAATWGTMPFGPRLAAAALATGPGAWLLGPGLGVLTVAIAVGWALVRLRGGGLGTRSGLLLAALAVAWLTALALVPQKPVERVHLLEYGLLGWLGWRALVPLTGGPAAWPSALLLGAGLGWAEELLQSVTPGRYYDPHDVLANALGVALGLAAVAVTRNTAARSGSLPASSAAC